MSFSISQLFDQFRTSGQPAPATPTTQPTPPGQIPPQAPATGAADNTTAPNGTIPPGTDKSTNATPLDQFADLWKDTPADPNAPPRSDSVFGDIDPKKFMEAAGKINFSNSVTPEQLQAISTGGEAAVKAFADAMNSVAQQVYAQSAFATTKIVDQAVKKARGDFLSEIPSHIKRHQVADNLRSENPIFNNPAIQPLVSAMEQQFTVKFPNATATEITAMAKNYIEQIGTSFAPKPQEPQGGDKSKDAGTDWGSFLS